MGESTGNRDTKKLTRAQQIQTDQKPPRRGVEADEERADHEIWAHLYMVWPTGEGPHVEFVPKEMGYMFLSSAKKQDTDDGTHRDRSQTKGMTRFRREPHLVTDDRGNFLIHPHGVFYNDIADPEYVVHRAKFAQSLGNCEHKPEGFKRDRLPKWISFVSDMGWRGKCRLDLSPIRDTYADAMGVFRARVLGDRAQKTYERYQDPLFTLENHLLELMEILFALTTQKNPKALQGKESDLRDICNNANVKHLLGEEVVNYWTKHPLEDYVLKPGDFTIREALQIKEAGDFEIMGGQVDVQTALRACRERTLSLVSMLRVRQPPSAFNMDSSMFGDWQTVYNAFVRGKLPTALRACYALTHPSRTDLRATLGWSHSGKKFMSRTGKNIFYLNKVLRAMIGYFGQVTFPETNHTLFEVYDAVWGSFNEIANNPLPQLYSDTKE